MPFLRRAATMGIFTGLISASTHAFPGFLETFESTYGPAKQRCMTCHEQMGGGSRNVYGRAVQAELGRQNVQKVSAAILRAVEQADSDGDGMANGNEIKAGRAPGSADETPAAKPAENEDIPKHSFHPVLIHFPIALFLAGVGMEWAALRGKQESLREGAKWNFLGAAAFAVPSVVSGVIASFRLGMGIGADSVSFSHMLLGLLSTAALGVVAAVRVRSAPTSGGYLLGLLAVAALVIAAGFQGGHLAHG